MIIRSLFYAMIGFALLTGWLAHSAELVRLPSELHKSPAISASSARTTMLRVETAKVVRLHYDRIRRDFPEGTQGMTDAQIRDAVLDCVGFISKTQLVPNNANTEIKVAPDLPSRPQSRIAYRPPSYRRAVVHSCFEGMMDAKGAGNSQFAKAGEYTSGLFQLMRALREDLLESVVAMILKKEGYDEGTVESYGTVALGFDEKLDDGTQQPAGLALRQSHKRDNFDGRSGERGEKVEAILRKYGLTSDHEHYEHYMRLEAKQRPVPGEQVHHTLARHNVQMDKNGAVFDFETIFAVDKFSNSPVNPDPKLRLPMSVWSIQELNGWATKLAQRIAAGEVTEVDVNSEYEKILMPLREHLRTCTETIAVN